VGTALWISAAASVIPINGGSSSVVATLIVLIMFSETFSEMLLINSSKSTLKFVIMFVLNINYGAIYCDVLQIKSLVGKA
jgi:hypothetical protein